MKCEAHRFRGISTHQHVTAQNRQLGVHDQFPVGFGYFRCAFLRGYITKSHGRTNVFSVKNGFVEVERYFCISREIEVSTNC
ncbi:hypothetical protein SDC9_199278 [bioreactor metagenome]|uniref:Uncharacterized protein n=1 Tax=bioreactor metagenome TaxID=1076179 RepID=A0A645IMD2_9ZZZZ